MVKDNDKKSGEKPEGPADFSQLADAFKDMPVQQLLSNPAAAFAAATAFGFGMASQMTDVFLKTMQSAAKASEKDDTESTADDVAAEPPVAFAKGAAPAEKPKPVKVAKPKAEKPGAIKPKPEFKTTAAGKSKASTAKAESVTPAKTTTAKPQIKAKPAAKTVAKPKAAGVAKKSAAKADDLKKISGIGPKLEQVLNSHGMTRFADIAGLTKARIDKLDDELGLSGRIGRDDWVGQAKSLSGDKS